MPAKVKEKEILTLQEAAEHLRCHVSTLYRLVKRGALPAFRVGGDWRMRRTDLNKWIVHQLHVKGGGNGNGRRMLAAG